MVEVNAKIVVDAADTSVKHIRCRMDAFLLHFADNSEECQLTCQKKSPSCWTNITAIL